MSFNGKQIVDFALEAIGEPYSTSPQQMTRAKCTSLISNFYVEEVGPLLNITDRHTFYSTDLSTEGYATLPTSDYYKPRRLLYIDSSGNERLLTEFDDIRHKLTDTDTLSLYMMPNETQILFSGVEMASTEDTIRMYYQKKPAAITDSTSSTLSDLKGKYHRKLFTTHIRKVLAEEQNLTGDYIDLLAEEQGHLQGIAYDHSEGRREAPQSKRTGGW